MPTIIELTEKEVPESCYIFKHSTRCPISAAAAEEVRSAVSNDDVYWINVVEQRPLSDWVETAFGVQHESPQLLRVVDGAVRDVWNHGAVRRSIFSQ
ncbi:MAG: DUF2847 family protein [Bdellovibrionales bacterium]|nr:DUF2847 family protein [Bdellovibrionales bacterium]